MAVPIPNLTLATGPAISGATVNAPFSIGGSASTGLSRNILLIGVLGLAVYWLIKR